MAPTGPAAVMGRSLLVLAAGLVVFAGCGSGAVEIAMTPLAGRIGGASWTLVSAESSAFLSDGQPTFFVTASAETVTACAGGGSSISGDQLILNVPKSTGDYRLSLSLSETFYVRASNDNLVATTGRIRVDEVTATSLRGGAHFAFDGNNEVDGEFSVSICPP